MGFLSSVISGLWDNINQNSANAKAKRAATLANDRNVYNYQHQIQWTVEDAKNAGINPAVAAGAPSNVHSAPQAETFKANAPDLANAINSAEANNINKQNANTNEIVGTADAIKKLKEAGVVDKNSASKELEAQAKFWEAETHARFVDSQINRINKMLPLEMRGQAEEIAIKAWQNKLNYREMKVLENTGLTLSEWKSIGKEITDVAKFAIGGKLAGGGKNSARNYSVDYYDRNGEVTGGKYISYH